MNIFILNYDFDKNAQLLKDKHILKMIVESTQILCNCFDKNLVPYKRTHYNHPCCKWARESVYNFNWLKKYALSLCQEYTYRYNKIHKCQNVIESLNNPNITNFEMTPFIQCMPDIYKNRSTIKAYTNYYIKEKLERATWKNRPIPKRFVNYLETT